MAQAAYTYANRHHIYKEENEGQSCGIPMLIIKNVLFLATLIIATLPVYQQYKEEYHIKVCDRRIEFCGQ